MKILIVEDEVIAANYLKKLLTEADFNVIGLVTKGQEAIRVARQKKPDLILMDIMLKDHISGVDAAIEINMFQKEIMIIFLTAYSDKEMIDSAIEANAFGYFLKPYNKEEILANLHILQAKYEQSETKTQVEERSILLSHGYCYHLDYKQLYLHQKEVYLSERELQVMQYFCENKHMVLKFEEIIQHIWKTPKPLQTLRTLIHRIREKTCQELIVNVNKLGYKVGLES